MRALFDTFGVPEFGLLFCRDPLTGNPVLQPRVDVIEKFPVDASEYQVPHHTFHLAVWKNSRGWISERNRTSCLVWIASSRLWFPRAFSNCTTLRIGSLHIFTAYAVHLTYLYNLFPASLNDSSQWLNTRYLHGWMTICMKLSRSQSLVAASWSSRRQVRHGFTKESCYRVTDCIRLPKYALSTNIATGA